MPIENKVASRELSEKLVKAGVRLETEFVWLKTGSGGNWKIYHREDLPKGGITCRGILPAPLLCELLEILPHIINDDYYLQISKHSDGKFFIGYVTPEHCAIYTYDTEKYFGASLEDCAVLLLIWLLEKGHIKTENVK